MAGERPMLVLSRGRGQWLKIDGPCRVYVVEITRGRVRLGVKTGWGVHVLRGELEEATTTTPEPPAARP